MDFVDHHKYDDDDGLDGLHSVKSQVTRKVMSEELSDTKWQPAQKTPFSPWVVLTASPDFKL